MRILVTGAHGMLGSAVIPYLQSCGHEVWGTDIDTLDVRDPTDILNWIRDINPDLVAHLAAETSLEKCEDDPDHAWLTNAIGTKNVALACARHYPPIPMAYISSAGIFDGDSQRAYTEFDTPHPINVYGASKYEGEKYVRQWVPHHFITRCGWMMGGGPHKDHKFVHHICAQIDAGVIRIMGVADKFGSPTYAPDFAILFESLITGNDYGTYHTVSGGDCSRYDMACEIVAILGADVEVRKVSSAFFASTFYAPRPTSEVMRNYVLDLTERNTMRPWKDALADYLKDWA